MSGASDSKLTRAEIKERVERIDTLTKQRFTAMQRQIAKAMIRVRPWVLVTGVVCGITHKAAMNMIAHQIISKDIAKCLWPRLFVDGASKSDTRYRVDSEFAMDMIGYRMITREAAVRIWPQLFPSDMYKEISRRVRESDEFVKHRVLPWKHEEKDDKVQWSEMSFPDQKK